jgi:hypothetical protein
MRSVFLTLKVETCSLQPPASAVRKKVGGRATANQKRPACRVADRWSCGHEGYP